MPIPSRVFRALFLVCWFLEVIAKPEGGHFLAPLTQDDIRSKLIDDLKIKILRGLHLDAPPSTEEFSEDLPDDVVQILNEDLEMLNSDEKENLIVHASNRDVSCQKDDGELCRTLEFSVPSDLESVVTVQARIHKRSLRDRLTLSVYSQSGNELLVRMKEDYPKTTTDSGWTTFELPKTLVLQEEGRNQLRCTVEVNGTEIDIEGPRRPFLVLTKQIETLRRKRRVVSTSSSNEESCRLSPETYHITVEDIGWQKWMHEPKAFDIKLCEGECSENIGSFTNSNSSNWLGRILSSYYQSNPDSPKPKCNEWGRRCKPSRYKSVSMIYKMKNGTLVNMNIQDLLIESCMCK